MCVFFIGGHTVGTRVLKFCMEYHIYPWEVIGYILFGYPNPRGQGALITVQGPVQPKPCVSGIFS